MKPLPNKNIDDKNNKEFSDLKNLKKTWKNSTTTNFFNESRKEEYREKRKLGKQMHKYYEILDSYMTNVTSTKKYNIVFVFPTKSVVSEDDNEKTDDEKKSSCESSKCKIL